MGIWRRREIQNGNTRTNLGTNLCKYTTLYDLEYSIIFATNFASKIEDNAQTQILKIKKPLP